MKRVIEITAKSPEEAQEVAKRELNPGEKVIASEVLSAPTKGMFGIVGNPEYRIRFTIDEVIEPVAPPKPVEPKRAERVRAPAPAEPMDDGELVRNDDDITELEMEDAVNAMKAEPSLKKYSIERIGKDHPAYEDIINVIKKVALNVGVNELILEERVEGDAWIIEAGGENVAQLIGKHGKTLDAVQYIVNIVANKAREDKVKIVLDVQGYRDQRHKGLIMLANRMFRKVIESNRQVELEPMSTVDRRTVHLALKDKAGIETFSRGVEPLRRVVIAPKKAGGPSLRENREPREPRGRREPRESGQSTATTPSPSKGRAVPMFMEEDGPNEE